MLSLSARRVWIEIETAEDRKVKDLGHSLRGECGLKSQEHKLMEALKGHSLRGECGLKLLLLEWQNLRQTSLSARRVWIEIMEYDIPISAFMVTLCEESVD